MKIKTPLFILEIEWLFLVVLLVFLFSSKIKEVLFSFFICYLFIVFHEFSHMFVASILGKDVEKFKVTLSGVCIEFKKEKYKLINNKKCKNNNLRNILIYLAGPISNIALARIFYNNKMICQINLFLAFVNLLPLFPLDGYNILENMLDLLKINKIAQEILFKFFTYILYFILVILGISQLLISKNVSIIIFLLYLFLLQNINVRNEKIYAKYTKNRY